MSSPNMTNKKIKWSNKDNKAFYENMPFDYYNIMSVQGGIDNCCDIKAIEELVKSSSSILEVGAGYGRVLKYFIKSGYKGSLYAIERDVSFCDFLKDAFGSKINIYNQDILSFNSRRKFDLILLMWSSICEFSACEQSLFFAKVKSLLTNTGYFVFDIIPFDSVINSSDVIGERSYGMWNNYNKNCYFGYFPDDWQVMNNINENGLKIVEKKEYLTRTNKKRSLYILGVL